MELIKDRDDLFLYLTTPKRFIDKQVPASVNVTSELRKQIMTDYLQGYFIWKGCQRKFGFKNLGGGVYSAFIENNC